MSKKTFSEDEYFGSYGKGAGSNWSAPAARCYESHPALPVETLGSGVVIYGGSCLKPIVKDADVYIGFDSGMQRIVQFPWDEKQIVEVYYPIVDRSIPQNPENFRKLVEWTLLQLSAGKKVHAGCIGGHGRTGTFLSALIGMTGEKDAIEYVRSHYCKKAVESQVQVDFLVKQYGVNPAKPTDHAKASHAPKVTGIDGKGWPYTNGGSRDYSTPSKSSKGSGGVASHSTTTVVPVGSKKNIWAGATD